MRLPLLLGRDFNEGDRQGAQTVVIVNQRMASRLWPGEDAIGKRIQNYGWGKNAEVIGVVGNSTYQDMREEARSIAYLACDQSQAGGYSSFQIRCRGSLGDVERDVLIKQDKMLSFLSILFGVLGVVLALVGVYGLISYAVTSRTREIGIRMSIGAERRHVLWLFLRESVMLIWIGTMIGMPVALWLAAFLRKMLYEVSTSDPFSISMTLLLLAAGGPLASSIPAARAPGRIRCGRCGTSDRVQRIYSRAPTWSTP